MDTQSPVICDWCGQPTPLDYVHGHAQCLHCKTNIAPCCDGGVCDGGLFDSAPTSRATPHQQET